MKRTIFIILPIVALLLSGCSIDIKSNKELQQERTKKQEINNTISWLNQQISWLEQTLIWLNQEIDLLQPKDNSWNEQMSSWLDLSWLDLADSTWIIKAINALDKQPITWSQLNWLEKFFNRFKELFNWWNKQAIWPQLSWLASTWLESEWTGINTGGDVKTEE